MNPRVICVIMGGGRGTRLHPLTRQRCKPAVPLAGKYRLVDIPISNCINSGMNRIFVLTQFNTASLHRHIQESYKFDPFGGGCVDILAAEQTEKGENWYQGTADAVRQNLNHFHANPDDLYLVLSGDQLYRMDFRKIVEQHLRTKAEVTIAAKPMPSTQVSGLGVMRVADDFRIVEFVEKPKDPAVIAKLHMPDTAVSRMINPDPEKKYVLANMGIYLFNHDTMHEALSGKEADFGKEIIPGLLGKVGMYSFVFDGYWEDIGTVASFFEANLSLTDAQPAFNFFEPGKLIYTHARFLPASRIHRCTIDRAIVADGCIVEDAVLQRAVIGVRSIVGSGTRLENVVMMGADFFEDDKAKAINRQKGVPNIGIGRGCDIRNAIIDKNARIGNEVRLSPFGKPDLYDKDGLTVRDGILVVEKNTIVPDGTVF